MNDDYRVFTWVSGADIKPERVDWWERHLIPRGCLTLIAGRGNSGKSTTCAAWAAENTRRGEVVVWLHSEESRSMHIVPKLHAAGADVELVKFLDVGVRMEDGTVSEAQLQLPRDLDQLEQGLINLGCRFLVFDALTSFKPSKMSANSGDDVRAFLEPIQRMAVRLNAVVLGIAHLGKDGERRAVDAVKGASEWTDVPRMTLAFHRDDAEAEGVISDVKGNLSPSPRSIGYLFESIALPEHGIDEVGRITFTGDVDTSVDEARRSSVAEGAFPEERPLSDKAITLRKILTGPKGELLAVAKIDVIEAMGEAGFSPDQSRRAREELAKRNMVVPPFQVDGAGPYFWQLQSQLGNQDGGYDSSELPTCHPASDLGFNVANLPQDGKDGRLANSTDSLPTARAGVVTCLAHPKQSLTASGKCPLCIARRANEGVS